MTKARRRRGSLGSRHIPALLLCALAAAGLVFMVSGSSDRGEGSRITSAAADAPAAARAGGERPSRSKRMVVVLAAQPAIEAALSAGRAAPLAGGVETGAGWDAARWQQRRESAVAEIARASQPAVAKDQRTVSRALRELGARVLGRSSAPSAIVAEIPSDRLAEARAIPGVADIEPAASDIDGSTAWHAEGCTGAGAADSLCAGAADSPDGHDGPDVALIDQGVNLFHSAWDRDPRIVTAPRRSIVNGSTNLCAPEEPVSGYWCGYGSLHGNAVAAIVGSRAGGRLGIAHGVDKLIDPLGARNTDDWLLGFTNGGEAPTADLPEVVNDSSGSAGDSGDPYSEKVADLYVSTFGVTRTSAAGNSPAQRVASPCIAHNTLCAGGVAPGGAGRADDEVAAYDSPGPTLNGRKKPDLLAYGASDCPSDETDFSWIEDCGEGTSYASARLAGAAALLAGAGVTDTNAQRALLINSAHMLPSAHDTVASGPARYWTPDGGWGELALERTVDERDDVAVGSVKAAPGATGPPGPSSARFYRVDALDAEGRVTLAWNRRINAPSWPQIAGFSAHTPTDLDLFLYKTGGDTTGGEDNDDDTACAVPKTGGGEPSPVAHCGVDAEERSENTGPLAVAADARDNVEQVRAAAAGSSIVKVKAASGIDGAASERFAVAAAGVLTELSDPTPVAPAPTLSDASPAVGDVITITAQFTNGSTGADLVDGLTLHSVSGWLDLPGEGLQVLSTSAPAIGTLAPGATYQYEWTVQITGEGAFSVRQIATGMRFGEEFESISAPATIVADATPPTISLSSPESWFGARTAVVSWSSADTLSDVEQVVIETSIDGAPFTTAYAGSDRSGALHVTAEEGQVVRMRARATDAAGNTSEFGAERGWTIDAVEPSVDLQAPPKVAYGARAQVVIRAFNVGAPVIAYGRSHPSQPFTPVDDGLLVIPAVARRGKPVTVEAQAIDSLNRIVRRSARIRTFAQRVGIKLRVVRKGKRKLLRVVLTRASTGELVAGARCGRKRLSGRTEVERATRAFVTLRGASGTCAVTVRLRPVATYQTAAARTAKRLRF